MEKHPDGDAGNDTVADDAEQVWDLTEEQEAQPCSKDDLSVVEDGNLPGGSTGVGCRDSELTTGCRKPCQKQHAKLFQSHGMKVEDQKRKGHEAGKSREKQNDERSTFASLSQHPHQGVGEPCEQASGNADEGWDQYIGSRKSGLDYQDGAAECRSDGGRLHERQLFFKNKIRKQNRKKRR